MWTELKKDKQVAKYFPNYSEKRFPNKKFLMNVVNTIKPNSIINAIKKIKQARKKKMIVEDQPILITNAYLSMLKEFQCLGHNKKVQGLGRLREAKTKTCPICFDDLRPNV